MYVDVRSIQTSTAIEMEKADIRLGKDKNSDISSIWLMDEYLPIIMVVKS
jgi:hypothetical protein